jgi:ABC-type transporter MlaC component
MSKGMHSLARFAGPMIATLLGTLPALAAQAKVVKRAPAVEAQAPAVSHVSSEKDPQKFVAGLYERLNLLSQQAASLPALHKAIGAELQGVVDYDEMGRLTLGSKAAGQTPAQIKQFTDLLARMVINTYVKRFKPGTAVEIAYNGVRTPTAGRAVVATTIKVKKTSADVQYAMTEASGHWMVYDIVVDDASQVQTYKQSFRKILDKEGWDGLIKRMTKAANKAPE